MLEETKVRRAASLAGRKLAHRASGLNPGLGADRAAQIALQIAYQQRDAAGLPPMNLHDVEFRNYSQNGEDGILLYLMALAGHGDRRAVEVCAGDGIECNTANLILHHGWDAVLVDGDAKLIESGRQFYASHPETQRVGPTMLDRWVTRDTVQAIIDEHAIGPIDLLSIDMDGMDYWILDAITATPRLIVAEYNNRLPAGEAITVPYQDDFIPEGDRTHGQGFFGASLDAFVKMLAGRGYRLIGANRPNTNAFFARHDVLPSMGEVSAASCLSSKWAQTMCDRWWPELESAPWERV